MNYISRRAFINIVHSEGGRENQEKRTKMYKGGGSFQRPYVRSCNFQTLVTREESQIDKTIFLKPCVQDRSNHENLKLDFRFLYELHFTNFENSEIKSRLKFIGGGGSLNVRTPRERDYLQSVQKEKGDPKLMNFQRTYFWNAPLIEVDFY